MPAPDPLPPAERYVRVLRLLAGLSLAVALVAVGAIAKGGLGEVGQKLIIMAIALGASALVGMAVIALPYTHSQKDKNDPRP